MNARPNKRLAKDAWVRKMSRRLQQGLILQHVSDWFVFGLIATGVAVLAIKLFLPHAWPAGAWVFAGLVPVLLIALWRGSRERFGNRDVVALLDGRVGAGGLLMALVELPHAEWESRLPASEELWRRALPVWRPVRALKRITVPAAFAGICVFIPPRLFEPVQGLRGEVARNEIARLNDQLKELEEANAINEEEKEELLKEIERLSEESAGKPLTHEDWQTVDSLEDLMRLKAISYSNELARVESAIAALQQALDAGEDGAKESSALERLLQNLGIEIEPESLDEMSGEEPASGLDENDENGSAGEEGTSQQGSKGGKSKRKGKGGRRSGRGLPSDRESLCKALDDLNEHLEKECKRLQGCIGEGSGDCSGDCPGSGEITRGRGDADMSWGEESDGQGVKFREVLMPEGIPESDGELLETRIAAPQEDAIAPESRSAARDSGDDTRGQAWRQTLRPRHRETVRKYFSSPGSSSPDPEDGGSGSSSAPDQPP